MLLSHVMEPTAPAYRLVDIYALDFLPAEEELRLALDALAAKHEVLRTAIIHEGVSLPRQAVTSRRPGLGAELPSYGVIASAEVQENQLTKKLEAGKLKLLDQVCRGLGATLANGLELAWGLTLQTACRLDDVVFGKVVSGRDKTSADVSELVGLFLNTVPLRVKTEKDATAAQMLKALQEQSLETNPFDFCPLSDIQKAVGMTEGLVYTSGSTGRPRGVVIQHKALLNFVLSVRQMWQLTEKSRIACHINFSFDASGENLYPVLTAGGCLLIVPEEARRDVLEMKKFIREHRVSGCSFPARFGQILAGGKDPLELDCMSMGGEVRWWITNS